MADVTPAPEGGDSGQDQDTGTVATPWADQHVDDAPVTPRQGVDQDAGAAVDGDGDVAPALDDSNSFNLDAGEIPDQAATDAIFGELTAMAPQATAALRAEWGSDAPKNLAFARATVREFADQEVVDFFEDLELDGKPLTHHPAIWKLMARIGRMVASEPGNPNSVTAGTKGKTMDAEAKERLTENIDIAHSKQYGTEAERREWEMPRFQRELRAMHAELHGDAPIVGTGGRTA